MNSLRLISMTTLCAATFMYCHHCLAQNMPEDAATANTSDLTQLDTTTVTARKRKENIIDVPFAVDVIHFESIENKRITSPMWLYRNTPGLSFSSTGGDGFFNHFQLRGVGPLSQSLSPDDSSVVTYIDGVPLSAYASDIGYLNLERIEVLRGPQGTLFGRNAQGGVINLITQKPEESRVGATVEAGTGGHASITGDWAHASDDGRLGTGVTARAKWRDGYVPNRSPIGGDLGEFRDVSARASALIRWGDDNASSLHLQSNWDRRHGHPSYNALQGDTIQVDVTPLHESARKAWSNNLIAEIPMGNMVFHGVVAFSGWDADLLLDDSDGYVFSRLFNQPALRFRPADDISDWHEQERSQYLEARLQNSDAFDYSWVVGYSHLNSDYEIDLRNTSSYSPMIAGRRYGDHDLNSNALFAEASMPVGSPDLTFTLGARHTQDRKSANVSYRGSGENGIVAAFNEQHDMHYNLNTGRAALSWKISPDASLYATAARGAKSGGFPRFTMNAATGKPTAPYAPSESWSYEAGYKAQFGQGRGNLSLAAFLNDVRDEQLMTIDFSTFQFFPTNLDTESSGFEASGNWALTPHWQVGASLNWTLATIEEAGASNARPGNRVPNVPRSSTNLYLDYEGDDQQIMNTSAVPFFSINHAYQSRRPADVMNSFWLPAYQQVDLRGGLRWMNWEVAGFVQNLSDNNPEISGVQFGPGTNVVNYGRGRVVGVSVSASF